MKTERIQSFTSTFAAHAVFDPFVDVNKTIGMPKGVRGFTDHFPGVRKMVAKIRKTVDESCVCNAIALKLEATASSTNISDTIETALNPRYCLQYIRPLAVRPLDHPERWPTPRGFLFSGTTDSFAKRSARRLA